ncbi:MAG: polyketide synthase dehydratase domain-containing protein [Desulfobacterales bacterium]
MGNLPQIGAGIRVQLAVAPPAHWSDHRFRGRAVLPAVEAMEMLAREAHALDPDRPLTSLKDVSFDKFLPVDDAGGIVETWGEFEMRENGDLSAVLRTRSRSPNAKMTRTNTHVRVVFAAKAPPPHEIPLDQVIPEGVCHSIGPDVIYGELVPFGPAYHNIRGPLWLSADGALAEIRCDAQLPIEPDRRLGSGFPLDAAFHAACVWGQRFMGMVGFPVSIASRAIVRPTTRNRTYFGRILPACAAADRFRVDILLLDATGKVCEIAEGVEMRDVGGGRLRPPARVMADATDESRGPVAGFPEMVIIDREAAATFGERVLSARGASGARQLQNPAVRIALKRLRRRLAGEDRPAIRTGIEAAGEIGLPPGRFEAAASGGRLAAAVGAKAPVGVHVLDLTGKTQDESRPAMGDETRRAAEDAPMAAPDADARIRSARMAVADAFGMSPALADGRVEVIRIGVSESRCRINGGRYQTVFHGMVADHLITVAVAE